MNFNNSPELFRSAMESYRTRNIRLIVAEGHVAAGADGIIARFPDDAAAIACLTEAGYIREASEVNIIFSVPGTELAAAKPASKMTHQEALRKALACLRVAKSSNPHEAGLAAAKAQDLITRYGLNVQDAEYDQQDAAKDKEEIKDFGWADPVDTASKQDRGWALRLLCVVARANGCFPYSYANCDGKASKKLCVIGRPSDVNAVRYLYSYFKSEVTRLCDANTAGNSGAYKNQYRIGVVDAISIKLARQNEETFTALRKENANNPMALVRVNNAIAKRDQRYQAVVKFKDSMKWSKGVGSGYTRTETGGRQHGQRDGAGIRTTSAKAGLGSGVKQLS